MRYLFPLTMSLLFLLNLPCCTDSSNQKSPRTRILGVPENKSKTNSDIDKKKSKIKNAIEKEVHQVDEIDSNRDLIEKDQGDESPIDDLSRKPERIIQTPLKGNKDSIEVDSQLKEYPEPAKYDFNPFYKKIKYVGNFAIASSEQVSDAALDRAVEIVNFITKKNPSILETLFKFKIFAAIMNEYEVTLDIPEHSDLPETYNKSARGLGPTIKRPVVTGAEENVLCFKNPRDRYEGENIFLHEFIHAVHFALEHGKHPLFRTIKTHFENFGREKWENTYASTNEFEYFAEVTQSWFNNNQVGPVGGNGVHNNIGTRVQLEEFDPGIVPVLAELFGTDDFKDCHKI